MLEFDASRVNWPSDLEDAYRRGKAEGYRQAIMEFENGVRRSAASSDEIYKEGAIKGTMKKSKRTCGDCIHESACGLWNVGFLRYADASRCIGFQRLDDLAQFIRPEVRRTGYWVQGNDGTCACSECFTFGSGTKYCANCGAHMNGKNG